MEQNSKKELFETMPVPKAVASMCVPAVVGSLVMLMYNMADTYFVGALNSAVQSSAVTLVSPLILAFNAVNNLFGVGSSSLMSRSLGIQDYKTTKRASAFGLWGALICAALISVFSVILKYPILTLLGADADTMDVTAQYMFWTVICGAIPSVMNVVFGYLVRAEGAAVHGTIGTLSGCLLNIILDPFFILPRFLNMGAAGAGLATFISNTVAVIYFLILMKVKKGKTFVSMSFTDFKESISGAKDICSVGIPAAIQNLLNVTGQTILNNFASAFGPAAVAAIGISHKLIMLPMYLFLGVSNGIMPLISYNYSAKNKKRMRDVFLFTIKIIAVLSLIITIIYFFNSAALMKIFIKDTQIVEYGRILLKLNCLAIPFLIADFMGVGVFQACGMGKKSLIFAVLRKIILEIPALFIWNTIYPMYGLALAQPTAELILSIAAGIMLFKIFKEE